MHNLEHGRVIIWFKPSLPEDDRADLKALFDEDTYQMVLVPRREHAVRRWRPRAWNGDPAPNGRGRLLLCNEVHAGDVRRAARVPRRAPLARPRAGPLKRSAAAGRKSLQDRRLQRILRARNLPPDNVFRER